MTPKRIHHTFIVFAATQCAILVALSWAANSDELNISTSQSLIVSLCLLLLTTSLALWWYLSAALKHPKTSLPDDQVILQNIVENLPALMYIVDIQGKYIITNKVFQSWLNLSIDLRGQTHQDLFPPDLADELCSTDQHVLNMGCSAETEHTIQKSKQTYTFLGTRFCLKDTSGKSYAVCCVATDITERKATEKSLQESEQNFRALTENANDGILVNLNGKHVFANRKIIEMLEYDSVEDFIGTSIKNVVHPDLYEEISTRAKNRISNHKQPDHYETTFITKDGKSVPIDMTVAVTNWQGQTAGFAIVRDIRERKKIESEIALYKEQLEELVYSRTERLQAANKELEAFCYSISHDLRAPLRSIDGFSQILVEDYHTKLDETALDYLNRVRGSAQHMSQLIDDILSLSRLSSTKLQLTEINLSKYAENLVSDLKQNHPDKPINAVVAPNIKALGDPSLLYLVLQNLIDNAWKYSSKSKQTYIEFGSRLYNKETQYYVRDKGIGFEMKYVNKLFTAFQRLHNSKDYPGSGIGLASVARIVKRHGGRVWAESKIDQGSTFYFTTGP